MRILVPVKRTIDPNVAVRVKADHSGVETEGVKMALNPFDEIAVEEAVRLKERGHATDILAVSLGPAAAVEVLRTALAIGATRALLVATDSVLEPLAVARLLAAVVAREQPDLVLMGKQAIDDDMGAAGQMLAALLSWPQATCLSGISVKPPGLVVRREIDGGSETLALPLPAVLTADLRLNEPRYASLPAIMRARKQPIATLTPAELGVDPAPTLLLRRVTAPPARQPGRRVASVAELLACLADEAKVL